MNLAMREIFKQHSLHWIACSFLTCSLFACASEKVPSSNSVQVKDKRISTAQELTKPPISQAFADGESGNLHISFTPVACSLPENNRTEDEGYTYHVRAENSQQLVEVQAHTWQNDGTQVVKESDIYRWARLGFNQDHQFVGYLNLTSLKKVALDYNFTAMNRFRTQLETNNNILNQQKTKLRKELDNLDKRSQKRLIEELSNNLDKNFRRLHRLSGRPLQASNKPTPISSELIEDYVNVHSQWNLNQTLAKNKSGYQWQLNGELRRSNVEACKNFDKDKQHIKARDSQCFVEGKLTAKFNFDTQGVFQSAQIERDKTKASGSDYQFCWRIQKTQNI
ncbi:MAG: hypothetical protein AAGB12_02245 [Pseudomonadota bacterium]